MKKYNQSLVDLFQTLPLSSFMTEQRSSLSTKESQTLYNLWKMGKEDEYGRLTVDPEIDPMQLASLTSKGYVRNFPSNYVVGHVPVRTLELTKKAKEVIKQIILSNEKSSLEKTSKIKMASKQQLNTKHNWLIRVSNGNNT